MSFTLKLDDMLELINDIDAEQGALFQTALETIGTQMATLLAKHHDCANSPATFQGVAFAGTCASFYPAWRNQPAPASWDFYDDGGREEWEAAAKSPDSTLPEMPTPPAVPVPAASVALAMCIDAMTPARNGEEQQAINAAERALGLCGQCEGSGQTQSASTLEYEHCPVCDGTGSTPHN